MQSYDELLERLTRLEAEVSELRQQIVASQDGSQATYDAQYSTQVPSEAPVCYNTDYAAQVPSNAPTYATPASYGTNYAAQVPSEATPASYNTAYATQVPYDAQTASTYGIPQSQTTWQASPSPTPSTKSVESFVGRYILPGLAALLIFAAGVTLVVYLWDSMSDVTKMAILSAVSILFAAGGMSVGLAKKNLKALSGGLLGTGAGLGFYTILTGGTYLNLYSGIGVVILSALWTAMLVGLTFITREPFTYIIISLGMTVTMVVALGWMGLRGSITQILMLGALMTFYGILVWVGSVITQDKIGRWLALVSTWFVFLMTGLIFYFSASHANDALVSYSVFAIVMILLSTCGILVACHVEAHYAAYAFLVLSAIVSVGCAHIRFTPQTMDYLLLGLVVVWWLAVGIYSVRKAGRVMLWVGLISLLTMMSAFAVAFSTVSSTFRGVRATSTTYISTAIISVLLLAAIITAVAWVVIHPRHHWLVPISITIFMPFIAYPASLPVIAIIMAGVVTVAVITLLAASEKTIYRAIVDGTATKQQLNSYDLARLLAFVAVMLVSLKINKAVSVLSNSTSTIAVFSVIAFVILVATRIVLPGGYVTFTKKMEGHIHPYISRTTLGMVTAWIARACGFIVFVATLPADTTDATMVIGWVYAVSYICWIVATVYLWKKADTKQLWTVVGGFAALIGVIATYNSLIGDLYIPTIPSVLAIMVGTVCIFIGFYRHYKPLRIYGLILIIGFVLKLVTIDIGTTNIVTRIVMLMIGGVVVFGVSLGYSMWEKKLAAAAAGPAPEGMPGPVPAAPGSVPGGMPGPAPAEPGYAPGQYASSATEPYATPSVTGSGPSQNASSMAGPDMPGRPGESGGPDCWAPEPSSPAP